MGRWIAKRGLVAACIISAVLLAAAAVTYAAVQSQEADDDWPGVPMPGSPFDGSLNESSDYQDLFYCDLEPGDTIDVSMTADQRDDFDLYLYDPASGGVGAGVASSTRLQDFGQPWHEPYPEHLVYTVPAGEGGRYTLKVDASSGSGPYTVTWAVSANSIAITKRVDADGDGIFSETEASTIPADIGPAGSTVTWSITATNTGDSFLTGVSLTDDLAGAATWNKTTLAAGEAHTITYTTTLTDSVTNAATVSGQPPAGERISASSSARAMLADIDITKVVDADADGVSHASEQGLAGTEADWTVTVENTGDAALSSISVDDTVPGLSLPKTTLAPGEQMSATYTSTIPADDVANTAEVSATYTGATAPVTDSAVATIDVISPAIAVEKSVSVDGGTTYVDADMSPGPYIADGQTIWWKIVVTNTGDCGLAGITVADSTGPLTPPVSALASGQSFQMTYSETAQSSHVPDDPRENVAYASASPPVGPDVEATDSAWVSEVDPALTVELLVDASDADGTYTASETGLVGDPAHWWLRIENSGDVTVTALSATDDVSGVLGLAQSVLGPGEVLDHYYDTTIDTDVTNTAVVTASPLGGLTDVQDSGSATIHLISPAIAVEKSVSVDGGTTYVDADMSPGPYIADGQTIWWKIVVTNTGDCGLAGITVADSTGPLTPPVSALASGQSFQMTYSETAQSSHVPDDPRENVAYASASPPVGPDVEATDSAWVSEVDPALTVELLVDASDADGTYTASETGLVGDPAHWWLRIENSGDVTVTALSATDDVSGVLGLAQSVLGPGEVLDHYYDTTIDTDVSNTAVVTASPLGGLTDVQDSGSATIDSVGPSVGIVKVVDANDDGVYHSTEAALAGSNVEWKITVRNLGDTDLSGVAATDSLGVVSLPASTLAVGEQTSMTYVTAVGADDVTNDATATAVPAGGLDPIGDSDSATVDVVFPGIAITKRVDADGDGIFSETEASTIPADIGPAGSTVTWSITATNTGDSFLTGVSLTDDLAGAATWNKTTLAAGEAHTITYTTTLTDSVTNAATVSGQPPAGERISASSSARAMLADIDITKVVDADADGVSHASEQGLAGTEADWTVTVENTGDAALSSISVDDTVPGLSLPKTTLAPGEQMSATYTSTIPADDVANTAEVSATYTGATAPLADSAIATIDAISPAIAVEKMVDADGDNSYSHEEVASAGATASWRIRVSNPSETTLTAVSALDDGVPLALPVAVLPPGGQTEVSYEESVTAGRTNTVAVSAVSVFGAVNVQATDSATLRLENAPTDYVPIQGANRYSTAVEASTLAFPDGAPVVIIATGTNWPDALGGAALAGAKGGPILLTETNKLPGVVLDEVRRLKADEAVILGGVGAVGLAVESALKAELGSSNVERIGGANRYETADRIAAATVSELPSFDGTCFMATGTNFPDALAASPLAAARGWPLYLTPTGGLGSSTSAAMQAAGVSRVMILGGTGVVSSSTESSLKSVYSSANVQRLSGANRYATAVAVASYGVNTAGLHWNGVALATGLNFPDALAGGVLQGNEGSVMMLTPTAYLATETSQALSTNRDVIRSVKYLGGLGAVSQAVRDATANVLW